MTRICYAYCLMNNHYQLVVETPDGNLSKGMRQLNGVYTQAFNKTHGRVGHVFQGRFKAFSFSRALTFLQVCRYVVLNPVSAGTVRHPRQWKWSSYRATAGIVQPHGCLTVDEILSHLVSAQEKYSDFVQAGIGNLQSGQILRPRVCWESKSLQRDCDTW